jgi:hypothetical protein
MKVFGEQYVDNRAHAATWRGNPVYGSVCLSFSRPCTFVLDVDFSGDLTQGVAFDVLNRKASVAGQQASKFVLWDYAPYPVSVDILGRKPPFEVRLWNVWEGPYKSLTQWMVNGGMRVAQSDKTHLVLECNAGPHPVTFDDMRIKVSWPEVVTVHVVLPEPTVGN